MPLHGWNLDTFSAIASVFGKVIEIEDWTGDRVQTYIGRVLILSNSSCTISETIALKVDDRVFEVRVCEDVAELVDFGSIYDLDGAQSIILADDGSGCGGEHFVGLPAVSKVQETPPSAQKKAKRPCQLTLNQ